MNQSDAQVRETLDHSDGVETLLIELSARFIGLAPDDVDAHVEDVQRRICEYLGFDRSLLFQTPSRNLDEFLLTHVYGGQDMPSPPPGKIDMGQLFPWTLAQLRQGKTVAVAKLGDFPAEGAHDRETLRPYGTNSVVVAPLKTANELFGALTFASTRERETWPESLVKRLQLVAEVFANALVRARNDKELRDSRERYELAVQGANDGLWDWDLLTNKVHFGGRWQGMLGYDDDEVPNLFSAWEALLHPEDREEALATLNAYLAGRTPQYESEHRLRARNGGYRWILARGRAVRDAEGRPYRMAGSHTDITERKQAEEALAESQARIVAVVENTSDLIWSVDPEKFGLLTFNTALATYFSTNLGIDLCEGMTPDDLLPPDFALQWRNFYVRALSEGSFVTEYATSSGTNILLLSVNRLERNGELFGISVFGKDITDRKRIEEALRQRNHYIETILEQSPIGFAVYRIDDGIRVFVSARFEQIYGLARGTLTSQTEFFVKVWPNHPVLRENVRRRVLADLDSGDPSRMHWEDVPVPLASGETRYVNGTNIPVFDQNLMVATVQDATDRNRAENASRESMVRFQQVAEVASDFIWEVDPDGLYTYTSPSVQTILGYKPEELVGKLHFYDLFAPDVRDALRTAALENFAAKRSFKAFSNLNMSKDGKLVHLETSGVPILDDDGNLVGYRGADTDVTERKRAEADLRLTLEELQRLRDELRQQNVYLKQEVKLLHGHTPLVGQSRALKRVLAQVEQVASTSSTVLLLGETGTGKELIASEIHELSRRRDHPMVRVNCSAIPTSLIESELFGREKGAYTGALSKQIGRFELANGSTLFLDEIGDLPPDVQVKLLRVLQERRIERLGSTKTIPVDVRIITATNHDLEKAVREGTFREDLFYRLNVFPITIPPLRERLDDIPPLVSAFVSEFGAAFGKDITSIDRESLETLQRYHWPGNVRELRNIIERAMIRAKGPKLWIEPPGKMATASTPRLTMDEAARDHIYRVLETTDWRVRGKNGAAEVLGVKPTTLESRMAKLGIYRPDGDRTK